MNFFCYVELLAWNLLTLASRRETKYLDVSQTSLRNGAKHKRCNILTSSSNLSLHLPTRKNVNKVILLKFSSRVSRLRPSDFQTAKHVHYIRSDLKMK
jgi:hypothetical protein